MSSIIVETTASQTKHGPCSLESQLLRKLNQEDARVQGQPKPLNRTRSPDGNRLEMQVSVREFAYCERDPTPQQQNQQEMLR